MRAKLTTTIKDTLNSIFKQQGVDLGKYIKEARDGEGSSTRKIFSANFTRTLAAEGLTAAATATHMVAGAVTNGELVIASAASATQGYSKVDLADNLCFDVDNNPFMEFKAKFIRDAAGAVECAMGLCSATNSDPDATTYNAFFRFVDRTKAIATNTAILEATIAGTSYCKMTSSAHGLLAGEYVTFLGMATAGTELNSNTYEILSVPTANTFVINMPYANVTSGTPSAGSANSLQVLCESDDNSTNNDDKPSYIPVKSETYYTFKIDAADKTDVKFYVDGVRAAQQTTFTFGTYASNVQPYFNMTKGALSTTCSVNIPYIRVEADA